MIENWHPIISNCFKKDFAYYVDVKLGNENEITYAAINAMISPRPMQGWILNPEACKLEVERIDKEIAQIKDFSEFIVGI